MFTAAFSSGPSLDRTGLRLFDAADALDAGARWLIFLPRGLTSKAPRDCRCSGWASFLAFTLIAVAFASLSRNRPRLAPAYAAGLRPALQTGAGVNTRADQPLRSSYTFDSISIDWATTHDSFTRHFGEICPSRGILPAPSAGADANTNQTPTNCSPPWPALSPRLSQPPNLLSRDPQFWPTVPFRAPFHTTCRAVGFGWVGYRRPPSGFHLWRPSDHHAFVQDQRADSIEQTSLIMPGRARAWPRPTLHFDRRSMRDRRTFGHERRETRTNPGAADPGKRDYHTPADLPPILSIVAWIAPVEWASAVV